MFAFPLLCVFFCSKFYSFVTGLNCLSLLVTNIAISVEDTDHLNADKLQLL